MNLTLFLIAMISSKVCGASSANIFVTELSKEAFILKHIDYGTNIGLLKTTRGIVLIDPMPGNENLDF